MLSILFIIITVMYFILIMSFVYGVDKVKTNNVINGTQKTSFSILIPFRNEGENLEYLLSSLTSLHYDKSKYEIILVDDDSQDNSVEIINKLRNTLPKSIEITPTDIKIIQNKRTTNSPKKDAITSAIGIAKYDWIVTTDADCIVPKHWLETLDGFIQENKPKMVVAPVAYHNIDSFVKRFQILDFLSLMGATIGSFGINSPFLCNGANLAYKKELFIKVNGFQGNTNIASGDDIFILEKALKADKKGVRYLKSNHAIVYTNAQPSWQSLVAQRKRWAAKTSHYKSGFGKISGLLVLFMNAIAIISVFLSLGNALNWKVTLVILLLKITSDFLLLYKTSRFFNQQQYLSSFFISAILYPFFSVYIAFTSLFTTYKWKGRDFKK